MSSLAEDLTTHCPKTERTLKKLLTLSIVLQSSIFVVVSFTLISKRYIMRLFWGRTFTESNTDLHSHVLSREVGIIKQSPRAARILEASCVNKGSEVCARGLGRLFVALEANTCTCT